MGSRSLGELLLRPTSLSRLSSQSYLNIRQCTPSWTAHRTLTHSASPQATQSQQRKEPEANSAPTESQNSSSNETSRAIDDLFAGMPSARRPPSYPRRQPSSSDELSTARAQHTFGQNFSPLNNRFKRVPLQWENMDMPSDSITSPSLANKPSPSMPTIPESEKVYPRLNPTYGRTVELDPSRGRDLVRGISMLGSLMGRNKVRADFMRQRYHERPGLKRKRLKSERWRARFKKGFADVTSRVTELTRKGW